LEGNENIGQVVHYDHLKNIQSCKTILQFVFNKVF